MADTDSTADPTAAEDRTATEAAIQKIESLLREKNDTSRFVGLALLKPILEKPEVQQNEETVIRLWDFLPATFLKRILRQGVAADRQDAESASFASIAISLVHAFIVILPESKQTDVKFVALIPLLVESLVKG
jgi:hypothetical protein